MEVDYEPEEEAVQAPARGERNSKGLIDGPHTYLGQRCSGRYPLLDRDTVIDRLDQNYGVEQLSSQDYFNPFLIHPSSKFLTLGSVNANCSPENQFQAFHVASSDTQPNTNSFLGVVEEMKVQRVLIDSLKISTMTSVTRESIDRFINETKCVRYVDNPQLV